MKEHILIRIRFLLISLLNGFSFSPQRQHCSETCSHRRWTEWLYILWMVSTLPSMPLVNFPAAVCHVILKIRLFRSVRGPALSFVWFMNRYMHWDCITVLMLWSCENMFWVSLKLTHFTVVAFIQTESHSISAPVMLSSADAMKLYHKTELKKTFKFRCFTRFLSNALCCHLVGCFIQAFPTDNWCFLAVVPVLRSGTNRVSACITPFSYCWTNAPIKYILWQCGIWLLREMAKLCEWQQQERAREREF